MNENNDTNFWVVLSDIISSGAKGYESYKKTTWIDKLITFIPFVLFLVFMYLLLKRK